jgi:hypothetical protein
MKRNIRHIRAGNNEWVPPLSHLHPAAQSKTNPHQYDGATRTTEPVAA